MTSPHGSSKSYIAIQLLVIPLATFFAVGFNISTLEAYQAVFPGYPHVITVGILTPHEDLRFLHMIGPSALITFSVLVTAAMLLFSFVGRPKVGNAVNFILLVCSLLFFLLVFVSYTSA